MKKSIVLLFAAAPLICGVARPAGDRVGNGGLSVVCRSAADPDAIVSAQLLDIFEGESIFGLRYPRFGNPEEAIRHALGKVEGFPAFREKLEAEIADVRAKIVYIPRETALEPTNDAFPPLRKAGCRFEQLANYNTELDRVLVDPAIHSALDPLNRGALIVHEAVYALARALAQDDSSLRSRMITSRLLARDGDAPALERLIETLLEDKTRIGYGLIAKAASGWLSGCYVKMHVRGRNEIHLNGMRYDEFPEIYGDASLNRELEALVASGNCYDRGYHGAFPLTERASRGAIAGCSVRPKSEGKRTLRIEPSHFEDYLTPFEDGSLEDAIAKAIEDGYCSI